MSRPLKNLEWLGQRDEAEQFTCLECDAAPGEHCVNVRSGAELEKLPAHWRRIKAAEEDR